MPLDPNIPNQDPNDDDFSGRASAFSDAMGNIVNKLQDINNELEQRYDPTLQKIKANTIEWLEHMIKVEGSIGKGSKYLLNDKQIQADILKTISQQNKMQGLIALIEKDVNTSVEEKAKALREVLEIFKEQEDISARLNKSLQKEQDELEKIKRNKLEPLLGIFQGLAKIPILGKLLDASYAVNRMERAIRPIEKGGLGISSSWGIAKEGIKGATLGLGSVLSKLGLITGVISLVVNLFKLWIGGMFDADKMITNIARNLGVTKDLAASIRKIYRDNKADVLDIMFSTQNQVEAAEQLNNYFGTRNIFSKELLKSQIDLTKYLGLSTEEAGGLNKIFLSQEMTAESNLKTIIGQTQKINDQKKIQLSHLSIIKDVSKLSGVILSNYKNQIPLLAKAVSEVRALGLSMDDAAQISSGLLDWQSSIENELLAELSLGRQLNFERARGFALMGKIDEAAKELMNTIGLTFDSFSNLNQIQKEVIAKSIGLTTDKLSDSLLIQKNLSLINREDNKIVKERLEYLNRTGASQEEINKILTRNNIDSIYRGLKELTIQEKFNQALTKAKEVFSDFVEGKTLNKLVDLLTAMVNKMSIIFKIGTDYSEQGAEISKRIQTNKEIGSQEKLTSQHIENLLKEGRSQGTEGNTGIHNWVNFKKVSIADAHQRIGNQVLSRLEQGDKYNNLAKIYAEEINKDLYFKDNPKDRDKIIKNFQKLLKKEFNLELPEIKVEEPQEDFIMKGNKIVPFRKDDLIMGGTNILGNNQNNQNNHEILTLLRNIHSALKEGRPIMMDSTKVGMALAAGTYRIP